MAETSPATTALESREPRFDREIGGFGPLAGFDFLAVGGLHARDLEAPIGANHGEAVRFDHSDFAELAADSLRVFRRQRLGVEYFQLLAVERRPRARRGIATADQPVDLLPRFAPIDFGIVGAAAAFVGRFGLILFDTRRLA